MGSRTSDARMYGNKRVSVTLVMFQFHGGFRRKSWKSVFQHHLAKLEFSSTWNRALYKTTSNIGNWYTGIMVDFKVERVD